VGGVRLRTACQRGCARRRHHDENDPPHRGAAGRQSSRGVPFRSDPSPLSGVSGPWRPAAVLTGGGRPPPLLPCSRLGSPLAEIASVPDPPTVTHAHHCAYHVFPSMRMPMWWPAHMRTTTGTVMLHSRMIDRASCGVLRMTLSIRFAVRNTT